ncbi:hypothetical protein [Pseudofulvibacter geojedonensis]|uniref:Uncharacterized protein n=1 Tax=Pseudofulvibacter geojedonensis TaxID=1123758 RepID=A0ABW3I3B0_9FLAO
MKKSLNIVFLLFSSLIFAQKEIDTSQIEYIRRSYQFDYDKKVLTTLGPNSLIKYKSGLYKTTDIMGYTTIKDYHVNHWQSVYNNLGKTYMRSDKTSKRIYYYRGEIIDSIRVTYKNNFKKDTIIIPKNNSKSNNYPKNIYKNSLIQERIHNDQRIEFFKYDKNKNLIKKGFKGTKNHTNSYQYNDENKLISRSNYRIRKNTLLIFNYNYYYNERGLLIRIDKYLYINKIDHSKEPISCTLYHYDYQ